MQQSATVNIDARVAELADAPDLGSGPERGVGSNPSFRIHLSRPADSWLSGEGHSLLSSFSVARAAGVRLGEARPRFLFRFPGGLISS